MKDSTPNKAQSGKSAQPADMQVVTDPAESTSQKPSGVRKNLPADMHVAGESPADQ